MDSKDKGDMISVPHARWYWYWNWAIFRNRLYYNNAFFPPSFKTSP